MTNLQDLMPFHAVTPEKVVGAINRYRAGNVMMAAARKQGNTNGLYVEELKNGQFVHDPVGTEAFRKRFAEEQAKPTEQKKGKAKTSTTKTATLESSLRTLAATIKVALARENIDEPAINALREAIEEARRMVGNVHQQMIDAKAEAESATETKPDEQPDEAEKFLKEAPVASHMKNKK